MLYMCHALVAQSSQQHACHAIVHSATDTSCSVPEEQPVSRRSMAVRPAGLSTPDATAAVLQVVIAKLQVITVGEFLPVIASFLEEELRAWKPVSSKPDVSVEARALLCRPAVAPMGAHAAEPACIQMPALLHVPCWCVRTTCLIWKCACLDPARSD